MALLVLLGPPFVYSSRRGGSNVIGHGISNGVHKLI